MNETVLIVGLNMLLQVTFASALGLAIAASLRRNPAARYWVLSSALMLMLLSPAIVLVMQRSGRSLLSVVPLNDSIAASSRDDRGPDRQADAFEIELSGATSLGDAYRLKYLPPLPQVRDAGETTAAAVSMNGTLEHGNAVRPPTLELSVSQRGTDVQAAMTSMTGTKQPSPVNASVSLTRQFGETLRRIMPPLLCVWVAGTVLLLTRLGVSWWRLGRILRFAKPNAKRSLAEAIEHVARALQLRHMPKLVLSDHVSGPISAGFFRPYVVLPTRLAEQLPTTQVCDILVHEIAHILRRDQLTVFLQSVAGAIFWLHPLVTWLNRALAHAREEVCDNYVLATTTAPSFSRTLLTLAEFVQAPRAIPGAVGLFTSRWKLESRVAGLLDEKRSRMVGLTNRAKLLIVGLLLGMVTVAALGTVTLAVGQDAEPQPQNNDSVADTDATTETQTQTVVTMRGTGADREMLLTGHVVDADGRPARAYELLVNLRKQYSGRQALSTKIEGNQFDVWVPIGSSDWFYLELSARTKDGKKRGFQGIANSSLRQAAIDEVILTLTNANRTVEVSVTKEEAAVAKAHVTAELQGNMVLHAETTADGKATFHLIDGEKLRQLTAWTDDFRIGGYLFRRKPRHDPLANEFSIELDDCRDQTIRLLNAEDDSPIPGVQFVLNVGTGPPNYNFAGTSDTLPQPKMTTNEDGEAIYRWFPDWEKHKVYVENIDPSWAKAESNDVKEADDGALVVKLKPRVHRKRFVGQVTSEGLDVGGLLLEIETLQGEEENHVDRIYAFTDNEGKFSADCIPGSTYCVCVVDERLVSNVIDLIPYDPDTGKSNAATLHVSEGELLEIRITSGQDREPMRNQWVNLRAPHDYKWRENGTIRHGSGGKQWGVRTDDRGRARARALAGTELIANVYAGEWRSGEVKTTIKADGVNTIEFHRESTTEREVKGRLIPPPNVEVDLANVEIVFGSIDGETDERQTVETDEQGRFAFKTKAIQFGIVAYTADGKAAGIATPQDSKQPVEVQLKQTVDLHGQLLGKDDRPLAGHSVCVKLRVSAKERDYDKSFPMSFSAKTFETKTDGEGNYTLRDLPSEVAMTLRADPIDDSDDDAYLDEFFLRVGDVRPRMVSRLGRTPKQDDRSLAEKYDSVRRDAALGDFHTMVLIFDSTASDFVDTNMLDYSNTKEVGSFMHLKIRADDLADTASVQFVKTKNWPSPIPRTVFACALDGSGTELGRITLDITAADAATEAVDFIRKHAPAKADADEKWAAAFAEAKRSKRKVWARVSQRYCGPCLRMSRWLDDNRELLERDYVLLKIDDVRDEHGHEVAKRIVSNRPQFGVPFHAIFDADEKLLIDSEAPIGNIGYPSSYEGRRHVKKMLSDTRSRLSPEDIEQIVDTMNE